jgi:hypothetical protein
VANVVKNTGLKAANVSHARTVLECAPELADAVLLGATALATNPGVRHPTVPVRSFADHDPADDARYERHPVEDLEPAPETDFSRMADALSKVLIWLAENRTTNVRGLKNQEGSRRYFSATKASLRTIAFLYCVRPDLVDGSLRAVAKRCGCSHEAIRKHVADFRQRFGYRTPGQWSDEARAKLSAAITERHRKAAERPSYPA